MTDLPTVTPDDAGDWRERIIALCGGDTIGEMLTFTRSQGYPTDLFTGYANVDSYTAELRYDPRNLAKRVSSRANNPAEALAMAILAATGDGR